MRVALDTNILAYAEGTDDATRRLRSIDVIAAIGAHPVVVPVQALNELSFLLARKLKRSKQDIAISATSWMDAHPVADTTQASFRDALALSALHNLQIFDAVILSAAAHANCSLLLSEDMHQGFTWRGCTVVNPFTSAESPLLQAAYLNQNQPSPSKN